MPNNSYFKKNSIYYVLFLCLITSSQWLLAASINVTADRNPVVLNERFTLTFSTSSNPAGNPDFSPLQQDFDIIHQGKSSSVQMINGDVNQNISWNLSLYPKTTGKIKIPAISFGADRSPEITLTVSDTPVIPHGQAGQASPDIFIEASTEPKTAYVQQQIIYVQRLYFAREFFDNATLSTPQIKSGKIDIEKLGNGREFSEVKNGRQYKVIERRYAIFPIQSGKLEIAPTFFEGRLIENGQQQSNRGFFSRPSGKVVRRYSPPVSIDVKPQANTYKGKHWLPATNVTLHANWSTPPEQAKTGEPLTLTLGIIANGLRAEQLPELTIDVPAGLKTYNDQPVLHNESNSNEMIATRQEKVVVVAAQPGEFVIPEITLSWWNVKTNSEQLATIPAKTMTVTGAVSGATPTIQPPTSSVPNKATASVDSVVPQALVAKDANQENKNVLQTQSEGSNVWFYLSLLLFLLLVFVLFLLWKQTSNKTIPLKNTNGKVKQGSVSDIYKLVQQARADHDNKKLRDSLIQWGKVYLKLPNSNLQNISLAVTDSELQDEIQQLIKSLYDSKKSDWNSGKLCEQVLAYRIKNEQSKPSSRISALYPDE